MELLNLSSQVALILKLAGGLAAGFYIIFAFVIVRQVNKMTETLEVGLESVLRAVAILHLLFSIGALIAVLVIL
ncbi:hypothetical protein A2803_01445 [Candidatus Woesebacteria bacterium RIFCSPHIGHO2_01_FULL_44_21]|uniref:Uncharacterized protein n=1 Tax=Candidatus Woesebacteria bacterium RIFCSPHIGHO2_01_FULL_44_21 TaxID=1802503 RepID=A0A1F7YZQ3_9BACT|nr:MAG: hypothetical protein A2803_01445 [Candidatus Woesebacteria bacterium RIFCSPHIGHO2_01_FULL_44_21]OGM70849.1 MAG: hypothetical protein A2897_05435 [Candidatus Woesebacteria bacterium RIFCSPLOWO2_01_FULL_44_24b]